jgi:hypothetical protein
MHRDVMEIGALLMRVLRGGEISLAELRDATLVAECDLRAAVLDAYVSLVEFARERERRSRDAVVDGAMRDALELCLERIIEAAERVLPPPAPAPAAATIH